MRLLPPPGPKRRRQVTALVVTVVVLLVVVWSQWPTAAPPVVASSPQAAPVSQPETVGQLPTPLRLADLEQESAPAAIGRNPFGFGAAPAPPPAPPSAFRPPVVGVPTAPPPAVPSDPPPIRLVLTGMLVIPDTGRTMVTLRDPVTGASFRAFEGEVLDGRYRLLKVSPQSVTVSYVDGSAQRTIALGGG